jgi:molybdopterin-guanine dinucleotide biosynthesis protein A
VSLAACLRVVRADAWGGRDKGLVPYEGRPLAAWVLQRLVAQTAQQFVIANRNLADYAELLNQAHATLPANRPAVEPDAPHLPRASGPLAGILTALQRTETPWLMVVPCDTPRLPATLVQDLLAEGERCNAEAVVPVTLDEQGLPRHHWVCVLVRKDVFAKLEALFAQDERKLRVCIQSLNWSSVSFTDATAFDNINSLETLNGRD